MQTLKLVPQRSLSRVGIDPSAALARARSQSRGRKRVRSEGPDVEMGDAEQQKRLHSSKSRSLLWLKASEQMMLLLCQCISCCVVLLCSAARTCSYSLFNLFQRSVVEQLCQLCLHVLQIHVTWSCSEHTGRQGSEGCLTAKQGHQDW